MAGKETAYRKNDSIPTDRMEYLNRIGLAEKAKSSHVVLIGIPGRMLPVRVTLDGWNSSDHAIQKLKEAGMLDPQKEYMFKDWPRVSSQWPGPASLYLHVPACACELEQRVYRLVEDDRRYPSPSLYGCPNAREMEGVVLVRNVEVLTYE